MAVAPSSTHRVDPSRRSRCCPSSRRRSRCWPRPRSATATGTTCSTPPRRFPDMWSRRSDLCFATTNRQTALMNIPPLRRNGGRRSRTRPNPRPRAAGARSRLPRVFRVNDADELPDDLTARWASPPARRRPRPRDAVIARLAPAEGRGGADDDEEEYFPPAATCATCWSRSTSSPPSRWVAIRLTAGLQRPQDARQRRARLARLRLIQG